MLSDREIKSILQEADLQKDVAYVKTLKHGIVFIKKEKGQYIFRYGNSVEYYKPIIKYKPYETGYDLVRTEATH